MFLNFLDGPMGYKKTSGNKKGKINKINNNNLFCDSQIHYAPQSFLVPP